MKWAFGFGVVLLLVAMWFVYGAIGAWLGADTVANLLTDTALFVAVGFGVGTVWGRMSRAKGA